MKKPLLTVCVITYNHAKYIRECIDSILAQQTDFEWELVVADDNSTDGTRAILKGYKDNYPDRIKLILQKKNVGAEQNWFDLLAYPKSEFMLYTEGDDYFTDPLKLQKQTDFLQMHPDHSLCFHPVKVIFETDTEKDYVYPSGVNAADFTLKELLNQNYIQTNSAMYRRQDYGRIPRGIIPGDWYLHLMHAKDGKIGFINEIMSVYRRHPEGTWWGAIRKNEGFWNKYAAGHLMLYREIIKLFKNTPHDSEVDISLARTLDMFVKLHPEQPEVFELMIQDFPDLLTRYLKFQLARYTQQTEELVASEERATELYEAVTEHRAHIARLEHELKRIHSSRTWKIAKKIRNASGASKLLKRR